MIINGCYKFRNAILVDNVLLENIEKIILDQYKEVSYSALLSNDANITFDSLDELLSYENHGNSMIKNLTIKSGYGLSLYFKKHFSFLHNYSSTVLCEYTIDCSEKATIIEDKLKKALDRHKQSICYTAISKISLSHFLILLLLMVVIACGYIFFYEKTLNKSSKYDATPFSILFSFVVMLISFFLSKVRDYLFPPITFYFGSEIQRSNNIKDIRKNIFWVIFVGIIIAVIVPKLMI